MAQVTQLTGLGVMGQVQSFVAKEVTAIAGPGTFSIIVEEFAVFRPGPDELAVFLPSDDAEFAIHRPGPRESRVK